MHLDLLLAVLHHRVGRFAGEGGAAAEGFARRRDFFHAVENGYGQRFERRAVEEHFADDGRTFEMAEHVFGNGLERRTAAEQVSGGRAVFHAFREVVRRRRFQLRAVFPERGNRFQRDAVLQRREFGQFDTPFIEIAGRGDFGHVLEQLCGQGFERRAAEESRREAVRFRLVGEECFGNALERCAVVEDASEVGQGGHVGQQPCRNAFQRLAAAEQAGCRGGFGRLFEEFFRDAL